MKNRSAMHLLNESSLPSRRRFLQAGVWTLGSMWSPLVHGDTPKKPGALTLQEIKGPETASAVEQKVIQSMLALSQQRLGYQMGSHDPAKGGLDCSGAVYRALLDAGVSQPPRSSADQYRWTWQKGTFRAVNGRKRQGFEFSQLHPGCLLFWTGTYAVEDRDPPISHVMIYLGLEKVDGREVMGGASDGRPYRGQSCHGVGVFDFVLPKPESKARFIGYAALPI